MASAFAQVGVPPIEVVVVDDGSSYDVREATFEIARSLGREHQLNYVERSRNRGIGAARNLAIREASHDLILPLDADDRLHPDAVVSLQATMDVSPWQSRHSAVLGQCNVYRKDGVALHRNDPYVYLQLRHELGPRVRLDPPTFEMPVPIPMNPVTSVVFASHPFMFDRKDFGPYFFEENRTAESTMSVLTCLARAADVGVCGRGLYDYMPDDESVSRLDRQGLSRSRLAVLNQIRGHYYGLGKLNNSDAFWRSEVTGALHYGDPATGPEIPIEVFDAFASALIAEQDRVDNEPYVADTGRVPPHQWHPAPAKLRAFGIYESDTIGAQLLQQCVASYETHKLRAPERFAVAACKRWIEADKRCVDPYHADNDDRIAAELRSARDDVLKMASSVPGPQGAFVQSFVDGVENVSREFGTPGAKGDLYYLHNRLCGEVAAAMLDDPQAFFRRCPVKAEYVTAADGSLSPAG